MAERVVYIAGTGRSGSTLVAQVLERQTGGVHVGELRYLWERGVRDNHLCECGAPFQKCEFWTEVLARAYGAGLGGAADRMQRIAPRVDRIRRIPQALVGGGEGYRADLRAYAEVLAPLYGAVAAVAGAGLVIDSSKDPSYLHALGGIDELDVLPVHLVRDPRAVAYSWTRTRRRPEVHWEVRYMQTLPPRRAARNWLVYNAAIDVFAARCRAAARLRYEDFARDPDAVTAGVSADLGLASAPPGSRTGHSLSGNPIRFADGPLVIRPDVEWETSLPRTDRRLVTLITLPLLRRYGYPVRAGATA